MNAHYMKPIDYLLHIPEPLTASAIAARVGRHINSVRRQIPRLRRWGLIERCGMVRPHHGRPAAAWILTPRGREMVWGAARKSEVSNG